MNESSSGLSLSLSALFGHCLVSSRRAHAIDVLGLNQAASNSSTAAHVDKSRTGHKAPHLSFGCSLVAPYPAKSCSRREQQATPPSVSHHRCDFADLFLSVSFAYQPS